jgi:hypothetical protein
MDTACWYCYDGSMEEWRLRSAFSPLLRSGGLRNDESKALCMHDRLFGIWEAEETGEHWRSDQLGRGDSSTPSNYEPCRWGCVRKVE